MHKAMSNFISRWDHDALCFEIIQLFNASTNVTTWLALFRVLWFKEKLSGETDRRKISKFNEQIGDICLEIEEKEVAVEYYLRSRVRRETAKKGVVL